MKYIENTYALLSYMKNIESDWETDNMIAGRKSTHFLKISVVYHLFVLKIFVEYKMKYFSKKGIPCNDNISS